MARMRRKRCEECEEVFEFVPIQDSKVVSGLRQRLQYGGEMALKAVLFAFTLLVCLPFSTSYLAAWLNQFTISDNQLLDAVILTVIGFVELYLLDSIQDAAISFINSKRKSKANQSIKKPSARSSLPVTSGSSWLSQVSPREYRAYLRRREYCRERQAADQIDSMLMDDNLSVSSMSNKSHGKQQVSPTTMSVSIREPIKCKICSKKTCIDKDHVVAASLKADSETQSVLSTGTINTTCSVQHTASNLKLSVDGWWSAGVAEVAKRTIKFFILHQFTLGVSLLLPYHLGTVFLHNIDGFMEETIRVGYSVVNYFFSLHLQPLAVRFVRSYITLLLNEHIARLLIGTAVVYTNMLFLKRFNVSIIDDYLHHSDCISKLALEWIVVPWVCGRGSIPHGYIILRLYMIIIDTVKSRCRSGLLLWSHPVCHRHEHAIGYTVVEGHVVLRSLPVILLSFSTIPRIHYGLPWYFILSIAVAEKPLILMFRHLCQTTMMDRLTDRMATSLARQLSLSSIIYGGRFAEEERFPFQGRYSFAPCQDGPRKITIGKVYQMHLLTVEPQDVAMMGQREGGRFKGFTVVYLPSFWIPRMAAYLVIVVGVCLAASMGVIWVPYSLGKVIMADLIDNKYVYWALGYTIILSVIRIQSVLITNSTLVFSTLGTTLSILCHLTLCPALIGMLLAIPSNQYNFKTLLGYWQDGICIWLSAILVFDRARKFAFNVVLLSCLLLLLLLLSSFIMNTANTLSLL